MRKNLLRFMAAAALMSPAALTAANSYGIPENIQDGNILHCFDWTFTDIIAELPNIAKAGFGAVQVSPVQGNAGTGAEWFYAYMPYDFAFKANGNGSRAQLQQLCSKADEYGIKIIVDVVANHVNQAPGYHDKWWDSNGRVRWNGPVNYGDRHSITHNQLGEYGDVNSEDAEVQARAKAFIEDLKSLGVKGCRWDAAKHIGLPSEGCKFWSAVTSVPGMWHYGEILDGPGGNKYGLLKEYTEYIGVTDSEYSKWTRQQVMNGQVPTGGGSWTPNGVPSEHIVYWAESHDDYSNDGQYGENTATMPQDKMDRAWAITACRKGETSLYFSRPKETRRNAIKMGQKGSTNFTSKHIAEVNKFRNAMVGTDDFYSHSGGVACVTRKGGGAVIVVGAGGSRSVSVPNGGGFVPADTYVDHISGNTFTVTASQISGQVGPTGIAVIYGNVTHEPSVTLSPAGGEFNGTVTVTATANNATSAWYKIGSGPQTAINGKATFTLGADMKNGESVTVSWSATGEEGTKTGSATYKKVERVVPANPYVYLDNTAGWGNPTVWAWADDGGNCCANATWPGDKMTRQPDGKWLWTAPDGKTPGNIIFSDGGNSQTADLTFVNGATYKCDGSYTTNGGGNGGNDEPAGMPASLYILGDLQGATWDTSNGITMTKDGSRFIASDVNFALAAGATGTHCYLNLTTALAADWDALNCSADRFGPSVEGVELTLDSPAEMQKYALNVNASACKSWMVLPGKYNIIADFTDMTLTATRRSGIDDVDIDPDAPAEFYNMQGVRVDNPSAGLYIKVQGGKVSKVLIP